MLRIALHFALIMIAVSAPPALRALAQDKIWRIGWLDLSVPPTADRPSRNLEAFQRGLGELSYKEGRNYVIDARFADTDRSRLSALAKELTDHSVDVIVTIGTPTVRAAKEATATIPITVTLPDRTCWGSSSTAKAPSTAARIISGNATRKTVQKLFT